MTVFEKYFQEISAIYQAGNATEHSYRPALKNLIESLASGIQAINEPKRIQCGSPDFLITQERLEIGYLEAKDIGTSLVEKTPQIIRYLQGLGNLILTDYLEFRWYLGGEIRLTATVATVDQKKHKLQMNPQAIQEASQLFEQFLKAKVTQINNPQELAKRLANLAQLIREAITTA
ncbi:MAG: hypothetical protein ACKO2V_18455 [Snowella sp.]